MKTRLRFFVTFAVLGTITSSTAALAEETELKLMSFNVRYGTAVDGPNQWKFRKDLLCDVIRIESPDVIGVQEAFDFQINEILKQVEGYQFVGKKREGPHGEEHSSILYRPSRFKVDTWETFWLSGTPENPSATWGNNMHRICTWARLIDTQTGRGFYLYNTHLTGKFKEAQWNSAKLILNRMEQRKHPDPVLFTGDLNAGEQDRVIKYIRGNDREAGSPTIRFVDSFRVKHPLTQDVRTGSHFQYLTNFKGSKIDYVFVEPEVEVLSAEIVRTSRDKRYPSDHFPVTARLRLKGAK